VDVCLGAQAFFDARKREKQRPSAKRLAVVPDGIRESFPGYLEIQQEIKRRKHGHEQERATLIKSYSEEFWKWHTQLLCGFNLLFYGFGSKKKLLENFAKSHLKDGACVFIDGNGSHLSIQNLLTYLTAMIFKIKRQDHEPWNNLLYSANRVVQAIQQQHYLDGEEKKAVSKYGRQVSLTSDGKPPVPIRRLYLIIHNLDNPRLTNERAKKVLSLLAAAQHIHIAASVDHVNAPYLWDAELAERFNWVWKDATTFASYSHELMALTKVDSQSATASQQQESQVLRGIKGVMEVLQSLTAKHHTLLQMVAKVMLQDPSHSKGIPMKDLQAKLKGNLIVNTRTPLSSLLKELEDHHLIKQHKPDPRGAEEYVMIPKDQNAIEYIMSYKTINNDH